MHLEVIYICEGFCRLEKVNLRRLHSQAKVVGTLVTVGGAMLMTLVKGPVPDLPWTKGRHYHQSSTSQQQHPIKGALMITAGCVCWACFLNLQVSFCNMLLKH